MENISKEIAKVCLELFNVKIEPELTRPDEQFGDYASNVALRLANELKRNPKEVAGAIADKLSANKVIETAAVAGPGFINITLTDEALFDALQIMPAKINEGKTIVVEYSDPNPFKVLHAGHLYTSVVGDSIASLLENSGAKVFRVNFGGDVGLHVAKTMWAILETLGGEHPEKLADIAKKERAEWLTTAYVKGTKAYEENEEAKSKIVVLNKQVYDFHAKSDHDSPLAQIYWTCREWSYDYFKEFYALIGSRFDKYYPESETAELGLKIVKEQLEKGVFKESDGAVVFDGEKYGLHTRVFINSAGLPTYETKDVGLSIKKEQDYHFDSSVIITGNDIVEYMKVVLKAIEQFEPELAKSTVHLTHGMVRMADGGKMSSRKGNILRAVDVLDSAKQANQTMNRQEADDTVLGAVKYAFLKNGMGGDIAYDPEESVSIHGNSGPYLQYAYARARSIIRKSTKVSEGSRIINFELNDAERNLVRKLGEYPEIVDMAVRELMPHHICTYLYELAQIFNRFYEENKVIGSDQEIDRIGLVGHYTDVLKKGLGLLNISAPEKM